MKVLRGLMVTSLTLAVAVSLAAQQAPGGGGGRGPGGGAGAGAGGGRGPGGGGGGQRGPGGGGAPGAGGGQRGPGGGGAGAGARGPGGGGGRGGGPIVVTNAGWADGAEIPAKHKGNNPSPQLSWTAAPGAAAYAILFHDSDAMSSGTDITHWMVWDIPSTTTMLPEGAKADAMGGAVQGRNIAGQNAYFGPQPPANGPPHHYTLEIYALNAKLELPATATRAEFNTAVAGKLAGRGTYFGIAKP